MASIEAEHVVALMKAAKVTENEALAFMGQALTAIERKQLGGAAAFLKELAARRATRTFPDLSRIIR